MLARLAHETDFDGFRAQARALLARGVPPEAVHWATTPGNDDLFAGEPPPGEPAALVAPATVPPAFLDLCREVVLHRDPQRFALLYRLLWRLVREPALRHDALDPDLLAVRRLAHAVRRDSHKMHAFLRFRAVADGSEEGPLHVAWFEPEHHVVAANADWFRRRFANMRWAILSPECSVQWDRRQLTFGPGACRDDAPPPDAGEALWLTYYRSIFNPARLKLGMMQKEMPRRYWKNLPEATLIAPLAAAAAQRSGTMIEQPPTPPNRRVPRIAAAAATPLPASPEALRARVQSCRACPLGAHATQGVCGEGPPGARLMFVGEQPGDQEDLQGRPFVGPAGRLFDVALAQAGLERAQVFVTNAVRHFGHELRGRRRLHKTPSQQEALACLRWLEEEIALVQPGALVALGATAARSLLGRHVAVLSERGRWFDRADGLQVFVTVHPSSLLRLPPAQRAAAEALFVRDLTLAGQAGRD